MVNRRPTLPIGFVVPGCPAVQRVLHTDEQREIYLVAEAPRASSSTVLFLHRAETQKEHILMRWWETLQGENCLEKVLDPAAVPGISLAALLRLSGDHLENQTYADRSREELETILCAFVAAIEGSRSSGMLPNLNPCLLWRSSDESLCALTPLDYPLAGEPEEVAYAVRSFYMLATGIDLLEKKAVPVLWQWCKCAGPDLSRIVSECIGSATGKARLTTFAQLTSALGRSRESTPAMSTQEARTATNDTKIGLGKVAGMQKLKALLLREVVEPVRNPEPFKRYGLSIPNGILLYGPPGCGKTYIARALAEELGYHFVEIIPSEMASPYVHGGVIRIRELFDDAAEHAPAIVFIDEFEALVPARTSLGGFQQHKAEEVNELLTHLNSSSERKLFVIAATNQPEMIDPAVRRTGRLDKLIFVGAPDAEARREMLMLHLGKRPVANGFDAEALASELIGYSASDLRFLVDEAARDALSKELPISAEAFYTAMTKIQPSIPPEIEVKYQTIEQRGL